MLKLRVVYVLWLYLRPFPKLRLGGILIWPVWIRLRYNPLDDIPKYWFCKITGSGRGWPSKIKHLVVAVDWYSVLKPLVM